VTGVACEADEETLVINPAQKAVMIEVSDLRVIVTLPALRPMERPTRGPVNPCMDRKEIA